MKIFFFLICFVLLCACENSSKPKNIGHQIAEAHGIENFNKIEMLEFIFNVQRDTAPSNSRHWQWFPKTNEVVFITDSNTVRFKRMDTTTQELKKLNARFTNDEYWLLYPFHLSWDKGIQISDSANKPAPISQKELHKVTIRYNDQAGFTPGDMYSVYIDPNQLVQEWTYHKAGAGEPSLMTTWEDYKDFNGMLLAQNHVSKDGKFRVWFTGIVVK